MTGKSTDRLDRLVQVNQISNLGYQIKAFAGMESFDAAGLYQRCFEVNHATREQLSALLGGNKPTESVENMGATIQGIEGDFLEQLQNLNILRKTCSIDDLHTSPNSTITLAQDWFITMAMDRGTSISGTLLPKGSTVKFSGVPVSEIRFQCNGIEFVILRDLYPKEGLLIE